MATLLKRSNGIYYEVIFSRGRRTWRSTGSKSRAEALKIISSNFKEKKVVRSTLTLSTFLPPFLEYAQANLAPTTVLLYKPAKRLS